MSVVRDYYKLKKFNVLEAAGEGRRDSREDAGVAPASQSFVIARRGIKSSDSDS